MITKVKQKVTFDNTEAITEELRAAVFIPVQINKTLFRKIWVSGLLYPGGAKKFQNLATGLRRMRSVIVAHNINHSLFRDRYCLLESARASLRLSGATIIGGQMMMLKRGKGMFVLHLSIEASGLPTSVERLRLMGRKEISEFLLPLGLEAAEHPLPIALAITQGDSRTSSDPYFNARSNTLRLESRTFQDHFLSFHTQTVELGLLLSTQVELLRSAERDLQKRMWPWNSLTKTRKQLWEWCIQEPPSNKYGKLSYETVWRDLALENRTQKILDALGSRAAAFANIYLIILTLFSAATAAIALFNFK